MDKNQLASLLNQGHSTRKIASDIGSSQGSVIYWMRRYGLKSEHTRETGRWDDSKIRAAVSSSNSLAGILRRLDLDPRGSNYITLKRAIERMGLDTSHLLGRSAAAGRASGRGRPIWDYLTISAPHIASNSLKKRLIREDLLEVKCQICNRLPEWMGKALVLRLDHIDGDNQNNLLANLRLICPNCDSQLPTYCGRNSRLQASVV